MSAPPPATHADAPAVPPAEHSTAPQAATPRPPSHNGSTSSSNATTPRSTSVEPGPTLWVEMWENQRWYPVIGWSTSRFQQDLPTFCRVPPGHRRCGAHPADFDAALNASNPPPANAANPHFPAQSIAQLRVPRGYRWVGYWEVCHEHRHGTDAGGWRYAEQFFAPDGAAGYRSDTLAPFKKTQTALCVVRRRLWRRRVAVLVGSDDSAAAHDDMYLSDEDMQRRSYLSDRDEEMDVAEDFKSAEAAAARAGTPWTREEELKAEEELRAFCRQRRNRESATRMRSTNPSFANPFQHDADAFHISPIHPTEEHVSHDTEHSGAAAASSWVRDSRPASSPQEASPVEASPSDPAAHDDAPRYLATSINTPSRVDGSDSAAQSRVQHFVASSPAEARGLQPDEGNLEAQNTVDQFVVSTPVDEVETAAVANDSDAVSVGGFTSPTGAEFRAIFSQFMSPSGEKPE